MKSFKCLNPKCHYVFPCNKDLRNHLNETPTCGSYGHKCTHCYEIFVQRFHLNKHLTAGICNDNEIMFDELSTINHRTLASSSLEVSSTQSKKSKSDTHASTSVVEASPTFDPNILPFLDSILDQQSRFHMHRSNANRSEISKLSQLASESLLHSLMGTHTLMIEYDTFDADMDNSTDNPSNQPLEGVNDDEATEEAESEELRPALTIAFKKKHWDFSTIYEPVDLLLTFPIPDSGVEDLQALREHIPNWDNIVFGQMQSTLLLLHRTIMNCRKGMSLYTDILDWATTNADALQDMKMLGQSPNIFKMLEEQFFGDAQEYFQPRTRTMVFSTGRRASVTTFSFIGAIVDLLLEGNKIHTRDFDYEAQDANVLDDVQSGTWWENAMRHVCRNDPSRKLLSLIFFIDSVVIGDYQKLSQIPVMFTLSCFSREERKRRSAWRVAGYIDYENNLAFNTNIAAKEKNIEFHEALKVIFAELAVIQKKGFQWKLKTADDKHETFTIHLEIQHIIADVEGADPICGRRKGHLSHMHGRARDCDVTFDDVDDPMHQCSFFRQEEMIYQTDEATLNARSFHYIPNPFYKFLSFGADPSGVFGCTPTECLHQFDQGLCVYVSTLVYEMLSLKAVQLLNSACAYICSSNILQSERDVPNISAFRNGFESVSKLKGEERFARVFILYLVLSCSEFVKYIVQTSPKQRTSFSVDDWQSVYTILEDTLILRTFLKQGKVRKNILKAGRNGRDSTLQKFIRKYMQNLKNHLPRQEGNGWKLIKFHQLLHIVPNILKHGSSLNTDSSIPEGFGKDFAKELARRTRRRTLTLGKETASRYFELLLIDKATRKLNATTTDGANAQTTSDNVYDYGSRFKLISSEPYLIWSTPNKKVQSAQLLSFPEQLLQFIVARLYYSNDGGKVNPSLKIPGFTEFRKDGNIFRAHPCFNGIKPWYDYCFIDWGEGIGCKPALINMFIDLREVPIIEQTNPFLRNEVYAIIQSVSDDEFSYDAVGRTFHLKSRLGTRYGLERQRRIVEVASIHSPAFVRPNDIGKIDGELHYYDNTIIQLKSKADWPLMIE